MTVALDKEKEGRSARRPLLIVIGIAVAAMAIIAGIFYFLHSMAYETTDDATITGHIVDVSSKVGGQVIEVDVFDNREVDKGTLLLRIDPKDYQARVDEAEAAVQTAAASEKAAQINVRLTAVTSKANASQESSGVLFAESGVAEARSQILSAASGVDEARAQYAAAASNAGVANRDLTRYRELFSKDEVSRQQLEHQADIAKQANANLSVAGQRIRAAEDLLHQSKAHLAGAQAQVSQAVGRFEKADVVKPQVAQSQAQRKTASSQMKQAQAQLELAKLNLSYTKVTAPQSGRVTQKSVEVGNYVQPGQTLLSIVPREIWVVANFKETQVRNIRPGQQVDIHVDTYPHKVFHGHVDSIQAGTGSVFSLLPPENATGNYVKVVQRIPVKIVFDEKEDPNYLLAPGMSVVPDVRVK